MPLGASGLRGCGDPCIIKSMILWEWSSEGQWRAVQLAEASHVLHGTHVRLVLLSSAGKCGLLARDGVAVNGSRSLPFRMLDDRDEIRVGGELYYFSTDAPADVVRFVDEGKKVCCARCKNQLQEADAVIYCPACTAAHDEDCFHYAPHCAMCPAPTEGLSWVPEPPEKSKTC